MIIRRSHKLMATLVTVVSLVPVRTILAQDNGTKTSATSVGAVTKLDKDMKGTKTILNALYNVADSLESHLKSPLDSKGIQKSEEQMRADSEIAARIHDIAVHWDHYDPDLLMHTIFNAALRRPNTELDDVIRAYIHAELDKGTKTNAELENLIRAYLYAELDKGTERPSVPVSTIFAQDKEKGTNALIDALFIVSDSLERHLRLPMDSKGIQKSEARVRADNETADRIHDIAAHFSAERLTAVVLDASMKQPNAKLDDVIRAYLHAELDRQKSPATKTVPQPPARQ